MAEVSVRRTSPGLTPSNLLTNIPNHRPAMHSLHSNSPAVLLALVIACLSSEAAAQLRVVTYNTANTSGTPRDSVSTVLEALGDQAKAGFARPIDILTMQEQADLTTTTAAYVTLLNDLYGAGTYASGTLEGATDGGGRPAVVYNTQSVQLVSELEVNTPDGSGAARATLRYQFRPAGYTSSADFYLYSSHFKASSGSSNEARRDVEANDIRANADALGNGQSIIYAGDLNLYDPDEAAFQTLVASGNGQAVDPLGYQNGWAGEANRAAHTQSPVTTAVYGGQVTGGMDDRFDFQLVSGELVDGTGFDLIAGSMWAFGNTGTHTYNSSLSTGSGAAMQALLPGSTLAEANAVITAVMSASDHLPVVADYQLPARLSAVATTLPAEVLRGASVAGTLTVTNSAPVAVAAGADALAYSFTSSGDLSGSASGSLTATAAGDDLTFTLDTQAAGTSSGRLTVTTSSPQVPASSFTEDVAVTVIDTASVAGNTGSTIATGASLTLTNASAAAGTQRASAAIASRSLSGDAGWSVSDFTVGTTVAAGGSASGTASFDASGRLNGTYTASFTLGLEHADQSLVGAATGDLGSVAWNLSTTLTGQTGDGSATVNAGASFAGLGTTRGSGLATQATLAAGTASATTTVSMAFADAPLSGSFFSDVLTLTGTNGDAVVLEMTYAAAGLDAAAESLLTLGWLDERSGSATFGEWLLATEGNASQLVSLPSPFQGSWLDYVAASSGRTPTNSLGAYGVDTSTDTLWAVIDHNSQFAAVPEPSGLALAGIGIGLAAVAAYRRRGKQAS